MWKQRSERMMWPHEKPEAHFTSHRLLLDNCEYCQFLRTLLWVWIMLWGRDDVTKPLNNTRTIKFWRHHNKAHQLYNWTPPCWILSAFQTLSIWNENFVRALNIGRGLLPVLQRTIYDNLLGLEPIQYWLGSNFLIDNRKRGMWKLVSVIFS
jgi:hypothetical protein